MFRAHVPYRDLAGYEHDVNAVLVRRSDLHVVVLAGSGL